MMKDIQGVGPPSVLHYIRGPKLLIILFILTVGMSKSIGLQGNFPL